MPPPPQRLVFAHFNLCIHCMIFLELPKAAHTTEWRTHQAVEWNKMIVNCKWEFALSSISTVTLSFHERKRMQVDEEIATLLLKVLFFLLSSRLTPLTYYIHFLLKMNRLLAMLTCVLKHMMFGQCTRSVFHLTWASQFCSPNFPQNYTIYKFSLFFFYHFYDTDDGMPKASFLWTVLKSSRSIHNNQNPTRYVSENCCRNLFCTCWRFPLILSISSIYVNTLTFSVCDIRAHCFPLTLHNFTTPMVDGLRGLAERAWTWLTDNNAAPELKMNCEFVEMCRFKWSPFVVSIRWNDLADGNFECQMNHSQIGDTSLT